MASASESTCSDLPPSTYSTPARPRARTRKPRDEIIQGPLLEKLSVAPDWFISAVSHFTELRERTDLAAFCAVSPAPHLPLQGDEAGCLVDRKSTRLNSSHANISYAVFCLKK